MRGALVFDPVLNGHILELADGKADPSTVLHELNHAVLRHLDANGPRLFEFAIREYEKGSGGQLGIHPAGQADGERLH